MLLSLFRTALLAPVLAFGQGPAARPMISFAKTHHDFGRINHDAKVSAHFAVLNAGDAELRITGLNPSCGCTLGNLHKELLQPGEGTDVDVIFDPAEYQGHVIKYVQVTSNDPKVPVATLSFEAEIARDIVLSVSTLTFHDLRRTSVEKASLRLHSNLGEPVEVTEMRADVPFISATLHQDGNDAVVDVAFDARHMTPFQSAGRAELTVGTTHPHFPQIPIPIHWAFKPVLASTPVRVAWVDRAERPRRGSVLLSHLNGRPFRILQVKPSRADLIVEGVGGAASPSHRLNVLFTTKAAGTYEESITFLLDDPDQPEFKLDVAAVLE